MEDERRGAAAWVDQKLQSGVLRLDGWVVDVICLAERVRDARQHGHDSSLSDKEWKLPLIGIFPDQFFLAYVLFLRPKVMPITFRQIYGALADRAGFCRFNYRSHEKLI